MSTKYLECTENKIMAHIPLKVHLLVRGGRAINSRHNDGNCKIKIMQCV